jgi:hypothetical protein
VVGHVIEAEVHFGEYLHQLVGQVILRQLRDDLFQLEVLDDLPYVLAVPIQITIEVELDIPGVRGQPTQVMEGVIVEVQSPLPASGLASASPHRATPRTPHTA